MNIKKIKVGSAVETTLGIGVVLSVGGTFPPSVKVEIVKPFPMGVRLFRPRDVLKEINPPVKP